MTEGADELRRFPAAHLERFMAIAFVAAGMADGDAATVAGLMVQADLAGLDGHGIFRLPQYVKRIGAGGINLDADIRVEREQGAMALIDGDNGMGHLVVKFATENAIENAKQHGIGWSGIRNGNHAGPGRIYPKMAMAQDMIGIYSAIGSANHLPPWGGIEMLLSTNPIAVAIPALDEPPVVLDMATTVTSYGNIKTAAQRGEQMPEGWMVDKEGQPLTDPTRAGEGFLLPIGGAKGYGLALILGFLAGTLNGAAFGKDVIDFNADSTSPTNTGQFICALNIEAFADVGAFKRQVDTVVRQMKGSPLMPGFDEVRLPGEASHKIEQDRAANGIPMNANMIAALDGLGDELGIGAFG